jgi:hypothetical protein
MNLTLGVLASVLALLPGLALIAAFNVKTRRGGARRPEIQLTAVSALVLAVVFSMCAHYVGYLVASGVLDLAQVIAERFKVSAGPVIRNPLAAGFEALSGKTLQFPEVLALAAVLFLEVMILVNIVMSRSFELLIDAVDYNAQGWVFEHITRPAENGYTPVGHVYTSTTSGRFGIAYKGAVTDIRQDEKGQVLSIALSRPERFLYEIGHEMAPSTTPPSRWRFWSNVNEPQSEVDTSIRHHGKEIAGGVVSLDARVISNIVVHCISNSIFDQINAAVTDAAATDRG